VVCSFEGVENMKANIEKFKLSYSFFHTNAWKYYKARNQGCQPDGCKTEYCQYDEPHRDYVYTQTWIDFLVKKLSDDEEYLRVKSFR